jgi:hypothetical protein
MRRRRPRQSAAGSATVDVVQFLTGAAAARAAGEDNAEVPPPNDYYIRNTNPQLRTLPVASDAPITINVHAAQESGSSTKDIPKTSPSSPASTASRTACSGSPSRTAG